jgi:glycosyltransferase involved in cell wall biosynthesis
MARHPPRVLVAPTERRLTILESYGFLSTYPPTQCGIATFTASLAAALRDGERSAAVGVVRLVERFGDDCSAEVVHQLPSGEPGGEASAAAALNRFDVAIVQHEYGIYGGPDGDSVVAIMQRLKVPAIAVLHTVLASPTTHQRRVLEQVAHAASVVVVMTETARLRLVDGYLVDASKVTLIPHGAPTEWGVAEMGRPDGPPTVLTWGLLGPGKGIEWAITAMASLQDLDPPPHYVVAGETHPLVLESHGESYRTMLQERADELGIGHAVTFENRYLDPSGLRDLVRSADVVLLPYDSPDQVTSGVLIEAVTARRPVVATAFPHAVELLSSGAGAIVGHRDSAAIAVAVRELLTNPDMAEAMVRAAGRLAPELTWAAVGERYREVAGRLHDRVAPAMA